MYGKPSITLLDVYTTQTHTHTYVHTHKHTLICTHRPIRFVENKSDQIYIEVKGLSIYDFYNTFICGNKNFEDFLTAGADE